ENAPPGVGAQLSGAVAVQRTIGHLNDASDILRDPMAVAVIALRGADDRGIRLGLVVGQKGDRKLGLKNPPALLQFRLQRCKFTNRPRVLMSNGHWIFPQMAAVFAEQLSLKQFNG